MYWERDVIEVREEFGWKITLGEDTLSHECKQKKITLLEGG